jgi:hypothetical protein
LARAGSDHANRDRFAALSSDRLQYQRKKQRDGGRASRAAVALMRKLAKALYHVARGAAFDSSKLFDVRRLQLPQGDLPLHRASAMRKSVVCLEAP